MEEEFIRNQERLKPQEEKIEEERSKVRYLFLLTGYTKTILIECIKQMHSHIKFEVTSFTIPHKEILRVMNILFNSFRKTSQNKYYYNSDLAN